jgi:metal-responsive CopG/Arc/MetJ family transcriptional regulator
MKTIAVSIDDQTLDGLDRWMRGIGATRRPAGGKRPGGNRSKIVRLALREFLERQESLRRNERDRSVLATHRQLIARQAKALVGEQAEP